MPAGKPSVSPKKVPHPFPPPPRLPHSTLSMSLVDSRPFDMHRKPVPQGAQRPPQIHIQPDRSFQPQPAYDPIQQQRAPSSHNRSRTASSSVFPAGDMQLAAGIPQNTSPAQYQAHMNQNAVARRSPSNATTSTTSTNPSVPVRQNSSSSLQRSSSSRSGGQPMSYVALMRKQKATVWSDRAQVRLNPHRKPVPKLTPVTARRSSHDSAATNGQSSCSRSSTKRQPQHPRLCLQFLINGWRCPIQDPTSWCS